LAVGADRESQFCGDTLVGRAIMTSKNAFFIMASTVASLLPAAFAQDQSRLFSFGATRADIVATFGRPNKWLAPLAGKYMLTADEYSAGLSVWDPIWDVYMRETKNNLYEVQVAYVNDTSASRLKPTERLWGLTVLVDKSAPATQLLADFPEATDICKSGCDLYSIPGPSEKYVLAYPSKPTPTQTQLGYGLATGFKGEPSKEEWCVAVKLILDPDILRQQPSGKPANYSGNVIKIKFEPDSLTYELYRSDPLLKDKAKKIGSWAPSPQP
jgi:hypothetical protein